MRSITLPSDVVVNGASISLVKDLLPLWLNDAPRFGSSVMRLYQAIKIAKAFDGKTAGETILLDDADWCILKDCVETPSAPYNPALVMKAMCLLEAVTQAKEV